ncbi:MAG: rhomboid family intramembrane serine protease [Lachnospiraceae bacterium]
MLNHIVKLLYQKGYRPFNENEGGILVRETEQIIYIVMLAMFQDTVRIEQYEQARRNAEFMAASRYRKKVETLYLIAAENGMFDEQILQLVGQLSGVWLVAADTGKIYVFENQPEQFDDLYDYLEKGLSETRQERKNALPFTLTPVNVGIVLLNIVYFFVVILVNGGFYAVYDTDIMLKMGALSYDTFMSGKWYQLVTSMFLHFGLSHLLNNMLLLTYAGCELEKRIGSISYLLLYLITGICGNLASLWYYNRIGELAVSAGASGAIFGVIGALFIVLVVNRSKTAELTPKRLLFMAIITIYYGMTTMGVDNAAHIGGFISGIIGGFLLSKISQYGKLEEVKFMR